jgi:CheY-like chemotaxis protein
MTNTSKIVVLVVEDEPILRMMAVDLVESAGFEAEEAANADEAIAILERRNDIRIVFSDIDMPGSMDGSKLAASIFGRWPPIKIILTSGLFAHADMSLPPGALFFAKPYDRVAVTAAMRRMAA